ncbi:diguanylate cyclase [Oxalobacteraceae bacterium CAVE-383]|nr:diguanylate cyclase [Oxalobacteraceae bacterium CAVE-383]
MPQAAFEWISQIITRTWNRIIRGCAINTFPEGDGTARSGPRTGAGANSKANPTIGHGGLFPRLLRSIDIRYRLIISFILVSLIPLLICGATAYLESSEAIRKKNGLFEAEAVKQIVQNIHAVTEKAASDATPAVQEERSPQAIFSGIFNGVAGGGDASLFVLDVNNGRILIRPPAEVAADAVADNPPVLADPGLLSSIGRIVGSGGGANFVSYNAADGRAYLAAFAPVADTTWAAVSIMPMQALAGEAHALRNKIIVIGAICSAFVLLISYAICRSVCEPLNRLLGVMKQTENGNYRVRLSSEGSDEIAVLSHKFNQMAGIVHRHHEQLDALVDARTRALRDANQKLEALSATDGLTGLANRRRLDEVLGSELRRAIRSSKPLAVIMLDVDFFKKYNDHYGHQAGDVCLRKVADALQEGCHRGGDLVARYGGEEFVLVAADTDMAGSLLMAETLRAAVESLRLPHCESEFGQVTVSIGVAALQPMAAHTADTLLRIADQAMYQAKLQGRNRVVTMEQELAAG